MHRKVDWVIITLVTLLVGNGAVRGENIEDGVEPLTTTRVASGLVRPVFATFAPDDYTRLFIIEKQGRVRVLNTKTGELQTVADAFLDIDALVGGGTSFGGETGLLGLAFDPGYQDNGYFYLNYTDNSLNTVVARYTRSTPDAADLNSAQPLLAIEQPQGNHNGGWIGFGPSDGLLYIATGDGGGANDAGPGHTTELGNAQDLSNNLLGKLLRLDVSTIPYSIPADNPFIGGEQDAEIWSYGLRNPWRCAFDSATGDLYIGDVGQAFWEEINRQPASSTGGENYGWRCLEGSNTYLACGGTGPFINPIHEYAHGPMCAAVIGGEVYRGCRIPSLDGHYFFAEHCSETIGSFRWDGGGIADLTDRTAELDPLGLSIDNIGSFGRDALGELYICDQAGGEIFQIISVNPTISDLDLDCNGTVEVDDLLLIMLSWGSCDGCRGDINGDHQVDVDDLTTIILNWSG